jgi:dephospho-CoA kinase
VKTIALTGGIATGKSYVLERFRRRGVPCLDADALARGVMSEGTEATSAIAARFGHDALRPDGSIDRHKLASIVFADACARRDLEAIVHPAVYRAIAAGLRAFESIGDYPFAIVDVPLLFETNHASDFDRVIVTVCTPDLQLARLRERGIDGDDARGRLAAQWPPEERVRRADFVITTDGSFEETDQQVGAVFDELSRAAARV